MICSRRYAGWRRPLAAFALLVYGLGPGVASAAEQDFVPVYDEMILARVPALALRSSTREEPRQDFRRDLEEAFSLLRRGRDSGDPRYLGYAESLLEPWRENALDSPDLRYLEARIAQARHDFSHARDLLEALLEKWPRYHAARLELAVIVTLGGDLDAGREYCRGYAASGDLLGIATCHANLARDRGETRRLHDGLARMLEFDGFADETRAWSLLVAAELAERLARPDEATAHYRKALAIAPTPAARKAYLEFLLHRERHAEAQDFLQRNPADFLGLRVLQAILDRRLGRSDWLAQRATIDRQLREISLRGEESRHRDSFALARFALHDDMPGAWTEIELHWRDQRSFSDARWRYLIATELGDAARLERSRADLSAFAPAWVSKRDDRGDDAS